MVLQQSIHYQSANAQMYSNHCRYDILQRGQHKWEITKTLIRKTPNGFQYPYFLDKEGKCVYKGIGGYEFPIIGEVEYTEEQVEMIWRED
ncbi:MAG: hypothetical protein ACI3T9_05335 [Romboutsia timonensis]